MDYALYTTGVLALLTYLALTHRIKSGTYLQKLLLGLDMFVSLILFRDLDITISSQCGLSLKAGRTGFLSGLGRLLNWVAPGHTDWALTDDIARAEAAIKTLKD
jgi:hypothetical protein